MPNPFQRVLGALTYLMLGTCPDISYTVATLGRHAAHPRFDRLNALDRPSKYLHGTADHKLVYRSGVTKGDINPSSNSLRNDNQPVIATARNPKFHNHVKHHQFFWHKVECGDNALDYVPTTPQLVDVLTKGLVTDYLLLT